MIAVEQRESFDCLTACLASIFEVPYEDCPILCDQETGEPVEQWLRTMTRWCWSRGVGLWHVGLWNDGDRIYMRFGSTKPRHYFNPPGFWIGGVKSPRYDGNHAVVMYGDRLVWDPHPQREMGHRGFEDGEMLLVGPTVALGEGNPFSVTSTGAA